MTARARASPQPSSCSTPSGRTFALRDSTPQNVGRKSEAYSANRPEPIVRGRGGIRSALPPYAGYPDLAFAFIPAWVPALLTIAAAVELSSARLSSSFL